MPTRTNQKKSGRSPDFPETTWVKCELSEGQKSDLKAAKLSDAETIRGMEEFVAEGFKISVSYDERSECVGAYLTAPKGAFEGRTVCLSSRAPRLAQCIAVLLYKHHEIMHGDWTDYLEARGGKSDW